MRGYIWEIEGGRIWYWGTHNESAIRTGVATYLDGFVPDALVTNIITGGSKLDIIKGYRPAADEDDIPHNTAHWDLEQYKEPGNGLIPVALVICQDYGGPRQTEMENT